MSARLPGTWGPEAENGTEKSFWEPAPEERGWVKDSLWGAGNRNIHGGWKPGEKGKGWVIGLHKIFEIGRK